MGGGRHYYSLPPASEQGLECPYVVLSALVPAEASLLVREQVVDVGKVRQASGQKEREDLGNDCGNCNEAVVGVARGVSRGQNNF